MAKAGQRTPPLVQEDVWGGGVAFQEKHGRVSNLAFHQLQGRSAGMSPLCDANRKKNKVRPPPSHAWSGTSHLIYTKHEKSHWTQQLSLGLVCG